MGLQASWVDHLFAKLSVRWGAAFMRQWPDTDPVLVKADWSEVLDGCSGQSLSYALRFLPASPCNAVQFRDLCRRAPSHDVPALAPPKERADPGRVAAVMARAMRSGATQESAANRCARNILRIADERGGRPTVPQREQLDAMRHMLAADLAERAAQHVGAQEVA